MKNPPNPTVGSLQNSGLKHDDERREKLRPFRGIDVHPYNLKLEPSKTPN